MKHLGYYNGKFGEIDEMTIPMNDRVCYFGDGVYDASYSRNYIIFALDEHIDRLYNSAALLRIDIRQTKAEMKEILCDMVRRMDTGENFVYWQVTRGTAVRNHVFPKDGAGANFWISIQPKPIVDTYKKIRLMTKDDTRFLHCNIKTLNLIPAVMASQEALEAGCDETVLHRSGRVTECAHSNVHILKDGTLRTAPTDNLILPGIARAHLIKACRALGIPVDETPFSLDEMMAADEVIVTSSGSLCLAAEVIDGIPVGGHSAELLRSLQDTVLAEFMAETTPRKE
ncbi:MAG: D-amino acid aminotransferase [Ruminococcaceae bacterium]|nr:D-amino acid aminotransferase [Oscillospiraceae bacterium]